MASQVITRQRVTGTVGFSEDLTASPQILDGGQRSRSSATGSNS
jgi:hypothetical protein